MSAATTTSDDASSEPSHARPQRLVMALFGLIAAYDLITGGVLLTSEAPWTAHGPGTVWERLAGADDAATLSLFRRLGALQIVAGAVTLGFLTLGRRDPRAIDMMLGLYAIAGLGLAWTDRVYFAGTPYGLAKSALGGVCGVAMLWWLVVRLRRSS